MNACAVENEAYYYFSPFSTHLNTSTHSKEARLHSDRFIQVSVYVLDEGLKASWERLIPLTWELIREYNWMSCCNSHIQVTALSAACFMSDWMFANPAWTTKPGGYCLTLHFVFEFHPYKWRIKHNRGCYYFNQWHKLCGQSCCFLPYNRTPLTL